MLLAVDTGHNNLTRWSGSCVELKTIHWFQTITAPTIGPSPGSECISHLRYYEDTTILNGSLMIIASASQFNVYLPRVNSHFA